MGVFLILVFVAVTLYMIYLGIHRGTFPVLLASVVFGLAFMIAIDFAPQLAFRLRNTLSEWQPDDLLALSYCILFVISFFIFGYLGVRFGPEIAPMYPQLDKMFGVVFGVIAGIIITGAVASGIFGFTRMQAFRERHGATDQNMWIKPHTYLLDAYGYVAKGMAGQRQFNPETALAGVGIEAPVMPFGGDGFWVSSVPLGNRIFVATTRGLPVSDFRRSLDGWVTEDWSRGPVAVGRESIRGYVGRTAVFVRTPARTAWIGVEVELTGGLSSADDIFSDSEREIYTYSDGGRNYAVKLYQITKPGRDSELMTLISLLLPADPTERDIENAMPGSSSFRIEDEASAERDLRAQGLERDRIDFVLEMARRGGKVPFRGEDGEWRVFEITTATGEYRIERPRN